MEGSRSPFAQFLYPEPFPPVRNTFLDDPMRRPASLEGFFQERQVFSCPVSKISEPGSGVSDEAGVYYPGAQLKMSAYAGSPDGLAEHVQSLAPARVKSLDTDVGSECSTADTGNCGLRTVPATPESDYAQLPLPPALPLPPPPPLIFRMQSAGSVQPDALAIQAAAAAGYVLPPAAAAAPPGLTSASAAPAQTAAPLPSVPSAGSSVQVLRLEEVLGPPDASAAAASVPGLPSAGSALHSLGQCRPCAFVATKGCSSGADCQFCHLCDAGEKKRRQKAKRAFYGALSEMTQRLFSPASNSA